MLTVVRLQKASCCSFLEHRGLQVAIVQETHGLPDCVTMAGTLVMSEIDLLVFAEI